MGIFSAIRGSIALKLSITDGAAGGVTKSFLRTSTIGLMDKFEGIGIGNLPSLLNQLFSV
jgi:hypothetical protein